MVSPRGLAVDSSAHIVELMGSEPGVRVPCVVAAGGSGGPMPATWPGGGVTVTHLTAWIFRCPLVP